MGNSTRDHPSIRSSDRAHITISDDRSNGSKFETNNRILVALNSKSAKPKTGEDDHQTLPNPLSKAKTNTYCEHVIDTTKSEGIMSDSVSSAIGNGYYHTLPRFEYPYFSETIIPNKDQMPLMHKEEQDRRIMMADKHDTCIVDIGALRVPEEAKTSFEVLQAYISNLQGSPEAKEQTPRLQIIHRIYDNGNLRTYLDCPQWVLGENNAYHLTSNIPISNTSAYKERHPEISVIVYRYYELSKIEIPYDDADADYPIVEHTSEEIELATTILWDAVSKLLKYIQKPRFWDKSETVVLSDNLHPPYLEIFHGRSIMAAFLKTSPTPQHLQFKLLLDYILSHYSHEYEAVDALLKKGRIKHAYMEYLFKPGILIAVDGKSSNESAYLTTSWPQKVKISKGNTLFIECMHWEFNMRFWKRKERLQVQLDPNNSSELEIASLRVAPLSFLGAIKDKLQHRGEMFWKCRLSRNVSYDEDTSRESHHRSNERFMVDMGIYHQLHKNGEDSVGTEEKRDILGPELMKKDTPPGDDLVYLLPPTIKGYSLKRKKWLDLQVDKISEVVWNKDAFEKLVIDARIKRLIEALVRNQLETEKSTDLISGKGNALILLLHGGPGTRKTLTAESVAEIAEKPLYTVTCGDIGTKPEEVETYLESVLHLGKTWGCVVLLDEADVFLEQRSLADLQRNALVSIFLRVLEYYDGILILTSNRVGTFDEAFLSRIQLAIHYPNLDESHRHQIWMNFISRLEMLKEPDIDFKGLTKQVDKLARHKMNGREIRNVITTARQFTKFEKKTLDFDAIDEIIAITGKFGKYIEKLNDGLSQDAVAEEEGLRLQQDV